MLYVFFLPHYFTLFFQDTNYKNAVSSLQSSSSISSLHSFQTAFICLIFFPSPYFLSFESSHFISFYYLDTFYLNSWNSSWGIYFTLLTDSIIFKYKSISPQFLHSPLQHIYKEYSSSVIFSSFFMVSYIIFIWTAFILKFCSYDFFGEMTTWSIYLKEIQWEKRPGICYRLAADLMY